MDKLNSVLNNSETEQTSLESHKGKKKPKIDTFLYNKFVLNILTILFSKKNIFMKLNLSNYYVSINTIGGHVKRNMYIKIIAMPGIMNLLCGYKELWM